MRECLLGRAEVRRHCLASAAGRQVGQLLLAQRYRLVAVRVQPGLQPSALAQGHNKHDHHEQQLCAGAVGLEEVRVHELLRRQGGRANRWGGPRGRAQVGEGVQGGVPRRRLLRRHRDAKRHRRVEQQLLAPQEHRDREMRDEPGLRRVAVARVQHDDRGLPPAHLDVASRHELSPWSWGQHDRRERLPHWSQARRGLRGDMPGAASLRGHRVARRPGWTR
mmetsp:Transcript_50963/g.128586  ORF Transcript_50963/g.128586 Transcript_50963/m.128586 type:complete len:221 (-) Transcript_50963:1159-1821(-)